MGWENSDRRERLPANWRALRLRVLRRDGFRCVAIRADTETRCTEKATDVDHIQRGDNHDLSNLQSLCRWHHNQKTAAEAAEARGPRPTQRRAPERHPGDL